MKVYIFSQVKNYLPKMTMARAIVVGTIEDCAHVSLGAHFRNDLILAGWGAGAFFLLFFLARRGGRGRKTKDKP